jgi:hypothetical protein
LRDEIAQFRSGVYRCNPPLIDPVNIDSHLANDVVKEPQAVDESVPLFGHVSIDSHLANEVVEQTQTVDESFPSASPDCELLDASTVVSDDTSKMGSPPFFTVYVGYFLHRLRGDVLIPFRRRS